MRPGAQADMITWANGVSAIDTEYGRPRHDASHLLDVAGCAAFIDTGVNSSVPLLLNALERQNLDRGDVEYVFVTHVHLDHAGGAGALMHALPNARCVLHPRAAPHMVDPTRLLAGTAAVYGPQKTRELYGTIEPIAERRIIVATDEQWFDLNGRALQVLYTEGHARHHYVLHDPAGKAVFTGDSFGVSYREHDTAIGETVFPTTTPVHFDPPAAHAAVDRIMACAPEHVYLTHYSRVGNLDRLAAELHAGIDAYVALALQHSDDDNRTAALSQALLGYYTERLGAHGYRGDAGRIAATMSLDAGLNAQGLEVWLDRRSQ